MTERRFVYASGNWRLGQRTYLAGILNVTPDSFSDGGQYLTVMQAMHQAHRLVEEGADMLDLGGESTRPGYLPVDGEEEWRRIGEVLRVLKRELPSVPVSVDTQKASVAARALDAGADVINDVGGFSDTRMVDVVRASKAGLVAMFNPSRGLAQGAVQVSDLIAFFSRQEAQLGNMGIAPHRILFDPGLGFAYRGEDNWRMLRVLSQMTGYGAGLFVGPSRKSFLGEATGLPVGRRDVATATVSALASWQGADVLRVHEPGIVTEAIRVADKWRQDQDG